MRPSRRILLVAIVLPWLGSFPIAAQEFIPAEPSLPQNHGKAEIAEIERYKQFPLPADLMAAFEKRLKMTADQARRQEALSKTVQDILKNLDSKRLPGDLKVDAKTRESIQQLAEILNDPQTQRFLKNEAKRLTGANPAMDKLLDQLREQIKDNSFGREVPNLDGLKDMLKPDNFPLPRKLEPDAAIEDPFRPQSPFDNDEMVNWIKNLAEDMEASKLGEY